MEGKLYRDEDGRWRIAGSGGTVKVLHCGDTVFVQIGRHWIPTGIEHDGRSYYATTPGVQLCVGLAARSTS